MQITFPNKTAKELVEEYGNKLGDGKLLYNTDWYEKEDFYTKERCTERTVEVDTKFSLMGKSWNECDADLANSKGHMLNFAELLFLALEHYKKTGEYLKNWSWTKSRASDGRFVSAGYFDGNGALVVRSRPDDSLSDFDCSFSAESSSESKIEPSSSVSPSRANGYTLISCPYCKEKIEVSLRRTI